MADRLSLAERMDLANDPRMKDPAIKMRVYQTLSPEDQQWVTEAMTGPTPPSAGGAMKAGADLVGNVASGAMNYARTHPVETGAAIGGIAAPLLTGGAALLPELAAAGLGGMGGAGLGMLGGAAMGSNAALPTTASGVAKTMIDEGGGQMAGTLLGRGISAPLKATGSAVMNSILPKSIAEDFPGAATTLVDRGINPTSEGGLAKASGLRRISAQNTRDLAQAAQAAGAPPITEGDLFPAMGASIDKAVAERKAGMPGGAGVVRKRLDALMDAQPLQGGRVPGAPAIPLSDASSITRELQDEGRTTLDALASAERPSRLSSIVANDLAGGIRRVANDRIPGYQASNATTQNLIGAERSAAALQHAKLPLNTMGIRLAAAAGLGGATAYGTGSNTEGALVGALPLVLSVPQIAGPTAIAAYKAGKLPYSMLLKAVSPEILKMLGITEPSAAQAALSGQTQ